MTPSVTTIITEVLRAADVPFSGVSTSSVAGQQVYRVETDRGGELIGVRGDTIRALDHVVRKIAEQRGIEDTQFLVDINDYRVKQIEQLQMKARMMAERARSFQYDVELTPMSSYERLIIHTTLADLEDIATESHGEGRNRRVVIRYKTERSPTGQEDPQIS